MKRADDFAERRKNIANLSDEELYKKFWELTEKVVDPLLELGRKNTTPSVERAVLLRMGISSLETKPIVEGCIDRGLMGKGAGHVVYKLADAKKITIKEAGTLLADGKCWDEAVSLFSSSSHQIKDLGEPCIRPVGKSQGDLNSTISSSSHQIKDLGEPCIRSVDKSQGDLNSTIKGGK